MVIRNMIKYAMLAIALLGSITSYAATLTASVDRKQITENDRFRLYLRFDEQVGLGQPDLEPLKKSFRIINQQRSNQFRSINGKTESYTEWVLVLSPEKTGNLTIPALSFKGQSSQEIELTVNKLSKEVKDKMAKEFFFDIKTSTLNTYVQAQVLYTEKLYYSVNHEDATLSELKVTDALVKPLGEVRQYTTTIDGQRLGVYERSYAIYPEESGEMVIPGQRFTAQIANPYNRFMRGRPVSVVAQPTRINVKATPANYPQAPWLPSTQIDIQDSWSKKPNEWQVGEPVTRTIVLRAKGLSGSQLPSIALPVLDNLKYYPDQSEHSDDMGEQGLNGIRQETLAIVPTQDGRVTIPEIRIPWWNLETEAIEYAILPAQTVNVAPAKNSAKASITPIETQQSSDSAVVSGSDQNASGLWVFATLFLLVTNLVTLFLLWIKRAPKPEVIETNTAKSGAQLFKEVAKACKKNDPAAIRNSLKLWAQETLGDGSLKAVDEAFSDAKLSNALNALDAHLFSQQADSSFNGQIIWTCLKQAHMQKQQQDPTGLKPLYG